MHNETIKHDGNINQPILGVEIVILLVSIEFFSILSFYLHLLRLIRMEENGQNSSKMAKNQNSERLGHEYKLNMKFLFLETIRVIILLS